MLPALLLFVLATPPVSAGTVPRPALALPATEPATEWVEALDRVGLVRGAGGVVVEADGDRWRLVCNGEGGVRRAVVARPASREEREVVAVVAASLLRAGPGARTVPLAMPAPVNPATAPASRVPATVSPAAPVLPAPPPEVSLPVAAARAPEPAFLVAAAPTQVPVATPASNPAVLTPEATVSLRDRPRVASPPLHLSASLLGAASLRPGLSLNPGGELRLRGRLGWGWVSLGGSTFSPTSLGVDNASLALTQLDGRAGVGWALASGWGIRVGAGGAAERWEVEDLDGGAVAWGAAVQVEAGVDWELIPGVGLDVALVGASDAQDIQIDAAAEQPSRLSFTASAGIRVGR